jgi:hypothetical protein
MKTDLRRHVLVHDERCVARAELANELLRRHATMPATRSSGERRIAHRDWYYVTLS